MIKKAQSRLQLSHNRANIDYWNHLHTRRVPFPDMEFPDTLKKHIHSDTLLHLKKHHEQHDKFIKKARSQINTRLSKRVVNEKLRKDRYRQMIVNRSSGKSQSARGRRSNHQDSKLRQHEPQYSVFKRKQKKIYNTHFTEEKDQVSEAFSGDVATLVGQNAEAERRVQALALGLDQIGVSPVHPTALNLSILLFSRLKSRLYFGSPKSDRYVVCTNLCEKQAQ